VLGDRGEAPSLRGAAALRLGTRFPMKAPGILITHMSDPDPLVRAQCIEALGLARAAGAEISSRIERYVGDPSLMVRWVAALTLAGMQAPAGEQALRDLVEDPATETMVQPHIGLAMYALSRHDLDTARGSLENALAAQPYNTHALLMLADVHARQGRVDRAVALLDELLRFEPHNRRARQRRNALGPRK
jgi:predicted Zn-dependent protease